MADRTTKYTLTNAWSSTNRYTAAGDTDVLLVNNNGGKQRVAFAETTNDTAPTMLPHEASILNAGENFGWTLLDTTRLWMALANGSEGTAALTV